MGRIAKFIGILLCSALSTTASHADDLFSILQLALENDPTLRQQEATYRANRENVTIIFMP